jgi:hypothetical protein
LIGPSNKKNETIEAWGKDMTDVKTTEREGNKPGRRRKKNLRTKDMTDVKTSIYLWTKDVTNIRCHVWCYWNQSLGNLLSLGNTSVGWVFDFFVIPICSDYLEKKNRMKEPLVLSI